MVEYNDRADDIIEHLDKATDELILALSKLNNRSIWLKLSSLYKLGSVLGKIAHVKREMKAQEIRRLHRLARGIK